MKGAQVAFIILLLIGSGSPAHSAPSCQEMFASQVKAKAAVTRLRDHGQRAWMAIDQRLRSRVEGKQNPLSSEALDADAVGRVHVEFAKVFEGYHDYFRALGEKHTSVQDYINLRIRAAKTIARIARDPHATPQALFAALEVVRAMSRLHSQADFPFEAKPSVQKAVEKSRDNSNTNQQIIDDPPRWQKRAEDHKPENRNQSGMMAKKSYDMVKTTEKPVKKLLRAKVYDSISGGRWRSSPLMRPTVDVSAARKIVGHSKLLITPDPTIEMPFQYGFEPVPGDYKGFSVREVFPEEFEVTITDQSLKEIDVPLCQAPPRAFRGSARATDYAVQSGINRELWPREILDFVDALKNQGLTPLQVAERIEKYIASDGGFLFYSTGDVLGASQLGKLDSEFKSLLAKMPEPVAMAHLKAFNQDGAAMIATLLLRDFLQIPARPVMGPTVQGSRMIGKQRYYVSSSTAGFHAWIEVWDGSRWHPFDVTPKKNTPKTPPDTSNLEKEPEKNQSGQGGEKDAKPSVSEQKEAKPEEKKDDCCKKSKDKNAKIQKGKKGEDNDRNLIDQLEVATKGGKVKRPAKESHSLQDALYHAANRFITEQFLSQHDRRETLAQIEAWNQQAYGKQSISSSFQDALTKSRRLFHEQLNHLDNGSIGEVLAATQKKLLLGDMTGAYADLRSLKVAIENVADHRELTQPELDLLSRINTFNASIAKHNHKDAQAFDLANKVISQLPGSISREWLEGVYGKDAFQLSSPGLKKFAMDILSGRLKTLIRATLIKEFAKVVLYGEQIPSYGFQKTSDRAAVQLKHDDLVLAKSPLELPRMLLNPRPGEHLFAPLIEGRQFALGQREEIMVPNPKDTLERKVSVVYYDISGSMEGRPSATVDSLLLSFVDMALSEVDPFNRPLHEIVIIPFNDGILPAVHIRTRADALEFIAKRSLLTTQAGGGTDIQKVLLHFYDLVASAHGESLKDGEFARILRNANLVLFSDGEAEIAIDDVLNARRQVPADVKLAMSLVSINGKKGYLNKDLIRLSEMTALSDKQSMYKDLSAEMMADIESRTDLTLDGSAFATQDRVPPSLIAEFAQLMKSAPSFTSAPNESKVRELSQRLAFNEKVKVQNPNLVTVLILLSADATEMNLPRSVRIDFMERLLSIYPGLSGRPLTSLNYSEMTSLQKLSVWALGK